MKLYDTQGYFNAKEIIEEGYKFTYVTGARGTGKTFSTLKYLIELGKPFIYLRRTQDESDLQANENTSSLTKVLVNLKVSYRFGRVSKKVGCIYIDDEPIIFTCALSTFASIRGMNFDTIKYIVFDEFITEPHVRTFRAEGLALMNLYESVNRNRELEGLEAVQLIGLSNSLNIANDTFIEFDLVSEAERLTSTDDETYIRNDILLIILKNSPISKKKASTTLYLNASEEFSKMAIENDFILNDFSYVKKLNIKEYIGYMNIGDLYVYKHKSKNEYYISFTQCQCKKTYRATITDLERLKRAESKLFSRYLDGYIRFDSYKAIALFEKYFK